MSVEKYFGIGTYHSENVTVRIDALTETSSYHPVIADDDFVYGADVHSPEIFAYNEQVDSANNVHVRTYAMYVFAKQSSEFPYLPVTLYANENPWSYIYSPNGSKGTLTYNNETYAYAIFKAYMYVPESESYYAYYFEGGIREFDPGEGLLTQFAHYEDGQDILYTEYGKVGNTDDPVSDLFTAATATSVLEYLLTNHAPVSGSAEIALKIKAPGQTLTFTSALLGSVVNQYISGDAVINMEGEPPAVEEWEILWVANAFGMREVMLIDYNFNCTHLSGFSNDVTGQLLKFDAQRQIVVANSACTASFDDADNSNHNGQPMTNTTYQANADIAQVGQSTTGTRFALFVLAKKNASARIPYELGFYWYFGGSAEACVVKANESMYLRHTDPVAGDKLAISADSSGKKISVQSPFSGKIKNADSHVTDYWREISGMSSDTMSGQFGIALAIPQ